jgi:O-antigen ligase
MTYIFTILLFLSQTIFFPFISYRWAKEYTFQILVVYILCYKIWQKNKWVALFLAWNVFLFIIEKGLIISDAGTNVSYHFNALSLLNMMDIIFAGLFYLLLHHLDLNRKTIYKTLCFIALFQASYVILQKLGLDQFFTRTGTGTGPNNLKVCSTVGTWANEALVSWLIVFCSPFFLAFKELRFKIGYLVCFIAVLCTKVTTGIVGFVLGFLFILWNRNKKIALGALVFISIISSIAIYSGKFDYFITDSHRFEVWKRAITIAKEMPITGFGPGSFRAIFPERNLDLIHEGAWVQAHNEYIQTFFEQGIIGLGIILGLVFTTILSFVRRRRGLISFTCLLTSMFISFLGFPFHLAQGAIVILALVLYERETWHDEATLSESRTQLAVQEPIQPLP